MIFILFMHFIYSGKVAFLTCYYTVNLSFLNLSDININIDEPLWDNDAEISKAKVKVD